MRNQHRSELICSSIESRWVHDSVTPDAPHLQPRHRAGSASIFGYGYQWWLPDSDCYCAIGVYNQFVYVDPARSLVIAKLSANRRFGAGPGFGPNSELEHMALLRAIAARYD